VKTSQEMNQEIRRIRERAKSLSGFWISEFAAGISTLEWALGKRDTPPSEDIGSAASGQGEIAKRLLDALSKAGKPSKPRAVEPAKPSKKGASKVAPAPSVKEATKPPKKR
jgi:hypothetical protein